MQDQAENAQAQHQNEEPWNPRWNWLLTIPDRWGVTRRWICALCMTVVGFFNGVLRFTPFIDSPDGGRWHPALITALSSLGVVVFLFGLAMAWSALRLQRYRRDQAAARPFLD